MSQPYTAPRQQRDGKIPATIWQIGIMMMLMNISFVMMYSLSGVYLRHIVGASMIGIGFLDGFCEFLSNSMKLFSGMISDFFRKRKGIILIGYIFLVLSKPLLAIASSFNVVFAARMMERFGNGIQGTPRDAIVADVAPRKKIGASYGLKRTLAYIGSMIGGIVGIIIMHITHDDFQSVFAMASIPAIVALIILIFCVKEPDRYDHPAVSASAPMPAPKVAGKFSLANFKYLGSAFWTLMCVNFIFMIARMNETFLTLCVSEEFGLAAKYIPLVMIIFNFGTSAAAYPIGFLGDKFDRTKVLFFGILALILSDIIMFASTSLGMFFIGVLLWGLQYSATQNIFVSLIAERVPEDLRGTGFGVYWLCNAIAAFIADAFAGYVAHTLSIIHVFASSGSIAILSMLILWQLINKISVK